MTCLLACIARTWYGVQRFLVHLVLRPAVLLAMGPYVVGVKCGRAAALVTHKPIYSYTDAQHRAYNYVTEWKFRFSYTNV